jgi:hypothetical protein
MPNDAISLPARDVPVHAEADVVVAGGGPAGIAAAVAAARRGAKTILVERYGFLGGMATAGLITSILGHIAAEGEPSVAGICREWVERMAALGGAPSWQEGIRRKGIGFDPDVCVYAFDNMTLESGVDLLLHSLVSGAVLDGDRLDALVLETKQGALAVRGKVFVDATGDADVVFRARLPFTKGRAYDGRPMAMGSMFHMDGIAPDWRTHSEEIHKAIMAGRESGALRIYGGPGGGPRPGLITANCTRCPGDATLVEDLTRAELAVRRDTWDIVSYYREHLPGFEGVRLARLPAHVGVRETRQAVGDYVLTGKDIIEARKQPDGIARSTYWIDIHCCLGYTKPPAHVCRRDCGTAEPCSILENAPEQLPAELFPPEGDWADIPYRSLTVQGSRNLLTAGRCISADHHAMGAFRVMAICMAIGEAAGAAAAMAADGAGDVRAVDTGALRGTLTEAGALV